MVRSSAVGGGYWYVVQWTGSCIRAILIGCLIDVVCTIRKSIGECKFHRTHTLCMQSTVNTDQCTQYSDIVGLHCSCIWHCIADKVWHHNTIFRNLSPVSLIECLQISFHEQIAWRIKPLLAVKLGKQAVDYTNGRFSSGKTPNSPFFGHIYTNRCDQTHNPAAHTRTG